MGDMKNFMDQYDCGIRYADDQVAQIVAALKQAGMYDDLVIIITSDHGENMGELGIYGEHATADEPTCHIPMIIKWPGGQAGARAFGLHDNVDLLPTVRELLGLEDRTGYVYDGRSYAQTIRHGADCGKDAVVLTQCCHVCQRSARFGDYLYIRTYHGGFHLFDQEMLFDVKNDPHETRNLAAEHPELCEKGAKIILDWVDAQMEKSRYQADPMWTVLREGGPYHARGRRDEYAERLKRTGRAEGAAALLEHYPDYK